MTHPLRLTLALTALAWAAEVTTALAQNTVPGKPEENGLTPKTATLFVNLPPENPNNGSSQSLGIAIASNGNILVGWEDVGDGLLDHQAVWTLYSPTGEPLIPKADLASLQGGSVSEPYRSFFRADLSPTPGHTAWGPKVKANLYGPGLGMGASAFRIHEEVPELAQFQLNSSGDNAGDFPVVQLLTNDGTPSAIATGVPADFAERDGDIRLGDWEYLANGNLLIVGENRQKSDLVNFFGGESAAEHVIYRIVDATGREVRAAALVSSDRTQANVWHGAGVTQNGFAIRFAGEDGRAQVRIFNNAGEPMGDNLDLGTVAGNEIMAGGGRGEGVGFHGNGTDAYAAVASGADDQGVQRIWATVLNADGSRRWSKSVSDDIKLANPDRVDVGIDSVGRVIVVYSDSGATGAQLTLGRVFDPQGNPLGGTFYVSEQEAPETTPLESRIPRVAFRNGAIAIVWETKNAGVNDSVVALRLFEVAGGGPFIITSVRAEGALLTVTWTGGIGHVEHRSSLTSGSWSDAPNGAGNGSATIARIGDSDFIRIRRD